MFYLYLVLLCAIHLSTSLESPEPEVLLQPRNYNPHPYQEGVRFSPTVGSRHGPVLFPVNPEPSSPGASPGLEHLQPVLVNVGPTIESHPYANVARKQKIKLGGRFAVDQENNINPQVYSGLANYAAKVLKKPPTRNNGYADVTLAGQKKDYAFSYAVRDRATGDDFSHRQRQDSKATHGEYRVKLPDGRIQIVSYTADKNGYKADVKYSDDIPGEEKHQLPQPQHQPPQPQHQPQPQLPQQAPQAAPRPVVPYYNYPQIQYAGQNPLTQIELPLYDEQQYQIEQVTPKYVTIYPGVLDELHKHQRQYIPQDKVEIYPQGEQKNEELEIGQQDNIQSLQGPQSVHPTYDTKVVDIGGSGVGTLLPYPDYERNVLVSTASPEYNQVYVTTPRHGTLAPTATASRHFYKR